MLYNLTLTEKQLGMIDRALEAVARMSIGQPDMCVDYALDNADGILLGDSYYIKDTISDIIKPVMGLSRNSSFGVGKFDTSDDLISIHEVIRHHLSWKYAKENDLINSDGSRNWSKMMGVNYDSPRQWGKEPLPTIEPANMSYVVADNDDNFVSLIRKDVYKEMKGVGIGVLLDCEKQTVKDMTKRAEYYVKLIKSGMTVVELNIKEDNSLTWSHAYNVVFEDILYVVQDNDEYSVLLFVYKDDIDNSLIRVRDIFNTTEGLDNRRQEFQDRLFEAYKVL